MPQLSAIGFKAENLDFEAIRANLQKMTDAELVAHGKKLRALIYPRRYDFYRRPTVSAFSIELDEARAEWRRRHPKPNLLTVTEA
jgi:hypothetical protein